MPRSLTLLVLAVVAPLSVPSFGCAERTKSEEATPAATVEPSATAAAATSVAPIKLSGMRRMLDVSRPQVVQPKSMIGAPAAAPATDASTD